MTTRFWFHNIRDQSWAKRLDLRNKQSVQMSDLG